MDVNDGSATPTNVRLSGCTVTAPAPAPLSSVSLNPATVQGGRRLGNGDAHRPGPRRWRGRLAHQQQHRRGHRPRHPDRPGRGHHGHDILGRTSAVSSTTTSVISATYNGSPAPPP